ncbi:type IV pilus assembly protein PilO [Sphaerotilus hippei]|uniref:Type IV pilus assembly protein PilO n=1 Tax=Sphaerotilus hippei TaxID=744406 RepID=A0A318H1R1_9BURK|nr:type 4a pilus biogenesis protein PilO [Sphaerotilus hippei]PXW97123.1 type IV pilus assembly protein PilO [Sphaerotilus hippei]
MATSRPFTLDFDDLVEQVRSQFTDLNPNEPGQWPILPKALAWLAAALAALFLAWFMLVSDAIGQLDAETAREQTLKDEYRAKLTQAINLDELRKQKLQVQEYVTQLERQLPGRAEMDALLSDINQAGLGRGLQFELFRPGQVAIRDYYAELPISLRVSGRYHDIGSFAADVANLSRIVTLHNLVILSVPAAGGNASQLPSGMLTMEATARTYRYLDPSEVEASQKAAKAGKPDGSKP